MAARAGLIDGARSVERVPEYRPQLCTLVDEAPKGDDWLHEIKFDGYRLLVHRDARGVRVLTRTGKDWTGKFGPIAAAVGGLACDGCVMDGEAAILDENGRTTFQGLQNAIKAGRFDRLAYLVFDLLYVDGCDLTGASLMDRKAALRRLMPAGHGLLRYTEHIEGHGGEVYRHACVLGLEGIICKRRDARYEQSRSRTWQKIKCTSRQEFVIIGWTQPEGSRMHIGSLLLAAHDDAGKLVYTGKVGTGFTSGTLKDLRARLDRLEGSSCPADAGPTREERRGARWVKAELVAEVEFAQWTDDGRLRHPVYRGLRLDKPASEVGIERSSSSSMSAAGRVSTDGVEASVTGVVMPSGSVEVAGVTITHADRVLYPDQGLTKGELALYYETVGELMLPYLRHRPLSTVRCPKGRTGVCFYQKHVGESFGDAVRPIAVREKGGQADYIGVDSVEGLVTLVQFGVLEIHPWGAIAKDLEHPDMLTFDLDPGEDVSFESVKAGARRVRDLLKRRGLRSFLKSTGGKGLHVVVPIRAETPWDEAKDMCASLAKRLEREEPEAYIARSSKSARRGKVFVDYLRNSRGATSVAPYSTRARPGAPVAMPLRWDELSKLASASQYTVESAVRRLRQLKDEPWASFFEVQQGL